MLGGNVKPNRGGRGGMHLGGRCVQIPWVAVGTVGQRLASGPTKHLEGGVGVGATREDVMEGEG